MMASGWDMHIYSAVGAALLWSKSTITRKKALGFGDMAELIFPDSKRMQNLFQFFAFVVLGSFIGVAVASPSSSVQAITGGVAWGRIISSD